MVLDAGRVDLGRRCPPHVLRLSMYANRVTFLVVPSGRVASNFLVTVSMNRCKV